MMQLHGNELRATTLFMVSGRLPAGLLQTRTVRSQLCSCRGSREIDAAPGPGRVLSFRLMMYSCLCR